MSTPSKSLPTKTPTRKTPTIILLTAGLGLIVLALFFRGPLSAWFGSSETSSNAKQSNAQHSGHGTHGAQPSHEVLPASALALPPYHFSEAGRQTMSEILAHYENIRVALVNDSQAGVDNACTAIADGFRKALQSESSAPKPILASIEKMSVICTLFQKAKDTHASREHFASLSEHLIQLLSGDPSLMKNNYVFECPMWEGFSQWIQPNDKLENPYMGQSMLTCGSEQDWKPTMVQTADANTPTHVADTAPSQSDKSEIAHYTCPMHPWVKKAHEHDTCPICGMDLTPVTQEEINEGIIRIDRERRQAFGITTTKIKREEFNLSIRAIGEVQYNQRSMFEVSLKYDAWIERLFVEETGQPIKKGQALFSVYGPDLFAAQQEIILASQQKESAQSESQKSRAEALLRGLKKRFQLWGFGNKQIAVIIKSGQPRERLTVYSKNTGILIEKMVIEGAAVKAGQTMLRIAQLDSVWIEAQVYEKDLSDIHKKQGVEISFTHMPGPPIIGSVSQILPALDPQTRTAKVRIELPNTQLSMRPGMFAEVDFKIEKGEALLIPQPAIVYSGPRRIVFVDLGDNRLRPTRVTIGAISDGKAEVLSGLKAGDKVVLSGNFLVAAESRLKSSTGIW